jgi:hypothetical protein
MRAQVEQVSNVQELSVCSGDHTRKLVTAPSIKSCCSCATGIVRDPRKSNVVGKSVPEDW